MAAFPSNARAGGAGHTSVRALRVAVAGSVLVHTLAIAWVAARELELPPVPVVASAQPPSPTVATTQPPVFEVTFLDDASNGGDGGAVAAVTGQDAPVKRSRITRHGGTTATTELAPATGDGSGERSPYMTMRKPGDEPLQGPSADFVGDFLSRSKPLPPPPDIPGERIGDQIADVRAKLKRAGRYSPEELAGLRAELVALLDERDAEELKPAGGGSYKTEKETFRAHVNPDGSVKLEDKPQNMDSQDRLMKSKGIDPYGRAKLDYLDRTRDQRVAIGKRHREQELKKSVIYMQQHIARLWSMTTDPAKRKQGLFDLWDECSEDGTPQEIAGGEAARTFVMNHIRAMKLTPDEIRAFDKQRRSKQPFAP